MIPRSSIKPLELVISAIHCLRERKGSSPQDIVKYLLGKYNVDSEVLKNHVQAGLKRGLSFGLITQKSGLYRLNDILSSPVNAPAVNSEKTLRNKVIKTNKTMKKRKFKKSVMKKGRRNFVKHAISTFPKGKRKAQKSKDKRKTRKRKPGPHGENSRRYQNETKNKKLKRQKTKVEKAQKPKLEKVKKVKPENVPETTPSKTENSENQRCSAEQMVESISTDDRKTE